MDKFLPSDILIKVSSIVLYIDTIINFITRRTRE